MTYTPAEAAKLLREEYDLHPHGKRVYTTVRHISASGLTQWLSVFVVEPRGTDEPNFYNITHLVGIVLSRRVEDKHGHVAIRAQGNGTNHAHVIVHDLGEALWAYTGQSAQAFECREI